ncbi:MAG TPA: ABC transporter permease [Silvibacterium sp.]|nr:ABC transporter permease [Silvibacterium sp.]
MSWLNRIYSATLGRRRSLYSDLNEELRQHLEEKTAQFQREGMSRKEAEQSARRAFGNPTLVEQRSREIWQWPALESLWADLKYALRQLRKSPGFAATVIVTLALGIGANVAIFSIVDAVLLRPLPYKDARRLVVVWQTDAAHRASGAWFNPYREFEEWQRSSRSFQNLAALSWDVDSKMMEWRGKPIPLFALPTSVDFFSMLGRQAQFGRAFANTDLKNSCTLVLAYRFWEDNLGAPRDIAGQSVTFDHSACIVVGVMPKDFSFYPSQADAWTLIAPTSEFVQKPWKSMAGVFGLLKPGVTRVQAEAELDAIEKRMLPEAPASLGVLTSAMPDVLDLQSEFTWLAGRDLRVGLWILLAAVSLVLLLACLNVANLLLGRAMERTREMTIRAALGSGRSRLIRQLLTESFLLALLGTAAGIGLAVVILRWFEAKNPVELPPGNTIGLHWQVLLFAAAIGIGAAVLFGMLPAWRGSRVDLNTALKTGERGNASVGARRLSRALVTAQIALSLVLLVGSGLLIDSLWHLAATPVGYRTQNVLTATIGLSRENYKTNEARNRLYDALAQRVAALPGVEAAVGSSGITPQGESVLSLQAKTGSSSRQIPSVSVQDVSANFFAAMQIPLEQGRSFDARDRGSTQQVAIINSALAEKYFPDENPIGHAIKIGPLNDNTNTWMTVVGVVANVKATTVFKEMGYETPNAVYRPLAQEIPAQFTFMAVTRGNPLLQVSGLKQILQQIDPNILLLKVQTLEDWQSQFLSQPRFRTILFASFAFLAMGLAVLGIYGLLAQTVLQRTREIGIRMALGASRERVLAGIVREALLLAGLGVLAGIAGSVLTVRALAGLLYQVRAENAAIFALASTILLIAAVFAASIPARRAASINPMQALRAE